MAPPRFVLFDLDGTLIDSLADIAASVTDVLCTLDCPVPTEDEIRTMIGRGARVLLLRALGDRAERLPEARALFAEAYRARLLSRTRLYDGVTEMLAALQTAGVTCAIATNKPALFTHPIVEGLGLVQAGLAWASGDEVPHGKPDPAVLTLALARAGHPDAPPNQVAYVGDMPVDVQTARAFGALGLGAMWGFDPEGLKASAPDELFARPEQLVPWVLSGG